MDQGEIWYRELETARYVISQHERTIRELCDEVERLRSELWRIKCSTLPYELQTDRIDKALGGEWGAEKLTPSQLHAIVYDSEDD